MRPLGLSRNLALNVKVKSRGAWPLPDPPMSPTSGLLVQWTICRTNGQFRKKLTTFLERFPFESSKNYRYNAKHILQSAFNQ